MATQTALSIEDYLDTPFDGVEPEYVEGEVVERAMPDPEHVETTQEIAFAFGALHRARRLWCGPELRVQIGSDRVRIPDYCVYRERPAHSLPTTPPLVVVEVVSPDDRYSELNEKLKEYHSWGVEHVWVADPHARELRVYDETGLRTVEQLELPEFGIVLGADDLFFA